MSEEKKKIISLEDLETVQGGCGKNKTITVYCKNCNWKARWTVPSNTSFEVFYGPCPDCNEQYLYKK